MQESGFNSGLHAGKRQGLVERVGGCAKGPKKCCKIQKRKVAKFIDDERASGQ